MTLGAIDIPNRTVDDFRAKLKDREAALAAAKKQRDTVLLDLRKANEAVDARDQKARLRLPALNKAAAEIMMKRGDQPRLDQESGRPYLSPWMLQRYLTRTN
jgi:hypothetical protein